jgi:hypothetical protein
MDIAVNEQRVLDVAAVISVPSALVAWFADTLPVIQWCAGFLAIVVSALAIYRHFIK